MAENKSQRSIEASGQTDEEVVIDLGEIMTRLLKSWKLIVCLALCFAVVVGAVTIFLITPKYQATSTIYVLSRRDSAINMSDLQIGTALTQDYIKVFKMWEVHEEVISNLNLPYTYEEMEKMLTVTNDTNTRMLDITITSPNPLEAAQISNEYAKVASKYIADTMSTDKPNIMSTALAPTNPVSPNKTKNIMLGFILGALLGIGIVVVQTLMDDKIKDEKTLEERFGYVVIGTIPNVQAAEKVSGSYAYGYGQKPTAKTGKGGRA